MKYRDKRTGAVYEPASEFVAEQMAKNPALEPVDERPKPKRRTPRKSSKDR